LSARAAALVVCLAAAAVGAAPLELRDDAGTLHRLEQPAARVIALAPHLSELVFAAGAGATLVGRDSWSDHPLAVRAVVDVGDAFRLDLERIVTLRPDIVLAWGGGTPPATIAKLHELGLRVVVLKPRTLDDPARHLELIGALTGHREESLAAAAHYRQALAALRAREAHAAPLRVFYQVNEQPLYTVNGLAPLGQVIALCGGVNPFAALAPLAPVVSEEAVIAADPQVILSASGEGGSLAALRAHWGRWPTLAATRRGAFHALDADLVTRPGPRLPEGAAALCAALDAERAPLKPR
jgi:iron complex transport system substrate-binding protein